MTQIYMLHSTNLLINSTTQKSTKRFALNAVGTFPGLALCGALAGIALLSSKLSWVQSHGLGALTIAILLGIFIANLPTSHFGTQYEPGLTFSRQKLLRLGIVLYGLRLTLQDVAQVGMTGIVVDAVMLSSTFGLAIWLGARVFRMDRRLSMLIGAGSAICGAAAVMAAEPIVQSRSEDVSVAVSGVVVGGSLSMLLYPLMYQLNLNWHLIDISSSAFGIYIGSTIHEVAQVVVAGKAISEDTANLAVITKMVRVMMLAPFLLILSVALSSRQKKNQAAHVGTSSARITLPWFAILFVLMVGFNSLSILPKSMATHLIQLDDIILAMAMAALGCSTKLNALRRAGFRPILLSASLLIWLIVGGALVNTIVSGAMK